MYLLSVAEAAVVFVMAEAAGQEVLSKQILLQFPQRQLLALQLVRVVLLEL
jgi:hypothetical protein